MRILIYNESAEGVELAAELKSQGHKASVVTPDEAQFDAKNPDPADEVHAWHSYIVHAYDGKADVVYHGETISEEEAVEMNEGEDVGEEATEEAVEEKPKRRGRAKIQ